MRTKLELTWIGKDDEIKIEPRILIENKELSNTVNDSQTENMLIHGDNLLALKALERKYAGQVKCIYIDPPYNTGSAFEHYDDNLEHSTWLSLMKPRLEILRKLLSDDGSIWITLDDNEAFYCKVQCDEIYGRNNYVGSIIWEKADSPKMDPKFFSTSHDFILVYAKDINKLIINKEISENIPEHYSKTDEDGRKYYLKPMRVMGGNVSESLYYPMIAPDGTEIFPISSKGEKTCWRWSKNKVEKEFDRIEWINGKNGWSLYFRIYADSRRGTPIRTIWGHEEVGTNRTSKLEVKKIFSSNVFGTPKPEALLKKVIAACSNEGDIVLDSFLGSGTTAAVAHKMGRKYIGVEMGEHAYTHCKVRLDKVVDGSDQGGISKSVNWQGGGGYKFYELAPSLINKDDFDEYVINKEYDPDMLASAVALHEGFTYEPDSEIFWKQAKGNETSFLFVTTRHINEAYLDSIKSTMEDGEYLIIACKSFEAGMDSLYPNITIKKIPQMLLSRCEFGRENYNLNIVNPPLYEDEEEEEYDE